MELIATVLIYATCYSFGYIVGSCIKECNENETPNRYYYRSSIRY